MLESTRFHSRGVRPSGSRAARPRSAAAMFHRNRVRCRRHLARRGLPSSPEKPTPPATRMPRDLVLVKNVHQRSVSQRSMSQDVLA